MTARYVIGIDLGTTNSVLAYSEIPTDEAVAPELRLFEIPQLVAADTVESRRSLPSFTYLATEAESASLSLPWQDSAGYAVGEMARVRGGDAPDRTVVAAKSWLCHAKVDRRAPLLPPHAPPEVDRISPVEATRRYLAHLVAAWNDAFVDAPLADQSVVLTVPASFDPVARELTREAALDAGLPQDVVLLEEPQAAVYAWLEREGDRWREIVSVGDLILVCDVGGGTTDLTLITVEDDDGNLSLRRQAVGDHLLVGGDNMDLAAAHAVAAKFAEQGTELNPWQSVSLWHRCRNAKEQLLAADGPERQSISILGRGSKLIGGTVSIEVDRSELAQLLTDGFFPDCDIDAVPQRQAASGFQELGLPYESDPGITRHIASFLKRHPGDRDSVTPDHVLFNGGVFKAQGFKQRLLNQIQRWGDSSRSSIQSLAGGDHLDHAVARGACFYGLSKLGSGVRIRGGVAHSYYVGIETAGLAIPGAPRPLKALCVVPHGMEEGTEVDVPSGEFGLVVGQPVQFRFFRSHERTDDAPGSLLDPWADRLEESAPLLMTLTAEGLDDDYAAVHFQSRITELGMFELWCSDVNSEQKWKLEFNVREGGE